MFCVGPCEVGASSRATHVLTWDIRHPTSGRCRCVRCEYGRCNKLRFKCNILLHISILYIHNIYIYMYVSWVWNEFIWSSIVTYETRWEESKPLRTLTTLRTRLNQMRQTWAKNETKRKQMEVNAKKKSHYVGGCAATWYHSWPA